MNGLLCRSIFVCSLNNFHLGAKMPLEFGYWCLFSESDFFFMCWNGLRWICLITSLDTSICVASEVLTSSISPYCHLLVLLLMCDSLV